MADGVELSQGVRAGQVTAFSPAPGLSLMPLCRIILQTVAGCGIWQIYVAWLAYKSDMLGINVSIGDPHVNTLYSWQNVSFNNEFGFGILFFVTFMPIVANSQ